MKKYFLLAVIFLCSLFTFPAFAQNYEYEHISEFNSDITINQDATIDVVEEIDYYFDSYKHGIYWEYPIEYNAYGFIKPTTFQLKNLYYYKNDLPERKYSFYEKSTSNGWIELKIGDPDSTIIGSYTYVIEYSLQDVGISYFEDHDEVYFNIIGPGWQVPILKSTATIHSFTSYNDNVCYTGQEGSTSNNCEFTTSGEDLVISTTNTLQPYDAFTFALAYPSGSIEDRTGKIWIGILLSNLGILLPIPVIIFLRSRLKKKWSNEKITVIPHYEPPKGLDPLMAGYIYKSKSDFKHISSTIIWLATKGYVEIEKENKKIYINKITDNVDGETQYIRDLFDALFSSNEKVNVNSMPSSFVYKIQSIFSKVRSDGVSSGYIDKSRTTSKSLLTALGMFGIFFSLFFLLPTLSAFAAIGTALGVTVSAIAMVVIGSKIDIKSKGGNELYYELEGLKLYIDTAEKHRIEFHNDPEKFRGVFEKLLPYAMLFGLEKKWAKEFEDLYKDTQPDWYRGNMNAFDVYMLSNSINTLNRGIKTSTSKAYGSKSGYRSSGWSSGGSGFSGGSSGGGGGGSGGGSW
jgi:uncharacterized membrane protein YgcG